MASGSSLEDLERSMSAQDLFVHDGAALHFDTQHTRDPPAEERAVLEEPAVNTSSNSANSDDGRLVAVDSGKRLHTRERQALP
eukprot:CAMPEP_0172690590 /NCGR_PEP_ID=MMETSP1074-20121228/23978_1 /TAXON_ID=2916 /ORGANISM="Ceratium fusus, Strain PA161109" /LENGTH=82 /DNA_ID=CAMNT_0013510561 /DNA_START=87 /DNA_END=332 /DNA_ORIENTATION=-